MKVKLALLSLATFAFTGCSEQSHLINEQKQDIDKEKEVQKDLIDRRTNEIKEGIQQHTNESLGTIEAQKKQLDLAKQQLDGEKRDIEKRTGLLKNDVDKQSVACKKQVDVNAHEAKEKVDQLHAKP